MKQDLRELCTMEVVGRTNHSLIISNQGYLFSVMLNHSSATIAERFCSIRKFDNAEEGIETLYKEREPQEEQDEYQSIYIGFENKPLPEDFVPQ